MRKSLAKIKNKRDLFYGIFERFGIKNGYKGPLPTVLLKDIKDKDGKIVSDHLWFNLTKGFDGLNLENGDQVEFYARVLPYVKGYKGYREDVWDKPLTLDYKLSHPTKLKKIFMNNLPTS